MKERPILFSAPMVRALLAGVKTQTRRSAKFVALQEGLNFDFTGLRAAQDRPGGWTLQSRDGATNLNDRTKPLRCPYGVPGDRLWVRESLKPWTQDPALFAYAADDTRVQGDGYSYPVKPGRPYVPSIHLARCWSRITLEVTGVRVERLQEISDDDCIAEGAAGGHGAIKDYQYNATPREHYLQIWTSINGIESWTANPWVWVVEFKRVTQRAREVLAVLGGK